MTKKVINTGAAVNDHTGDSLRAAAVKINDNFAEIYQAIGDGTTPTLATIAKTGSWAQLQDKPQVNQLAGYQAQVVDLIPTDVNQLTDVDNLINAPTFAWNDITGKPSFFSGSYNDLTNKPTIPSVTGLASETYVNTHINSAITTATENLQSNINTTLASYALAASVPTDISNLTDSNNLLNAPISTLHNGVHSVSLESNGVLKVETAGVKFGDNTTQTTAYPGSSILNGYATQTYVSSTVSTAINNLIADAPATYDTLKEIADQLSTDGSAINSIITSLGTKANASSLATVATTGSYNDLTNKPTLFSGSYNDLTNKPVIDYTTTNQFFVDPARTDSYTPTGSVIKPFKSIAAAQTAIESLITAGTISPAESNPIFIVLCGSTTENVTLTRGHVFLVGFNGSIHAPIYLNGTVTVNGSNTSTNALDVNHFSLQGITIVGPVQKACIHFTGSNAQRLQLKDIWMTANGSRTGSTPFTNAGGYGIYADNTGVRSSDGKKSAIHGSDIKVSHTGSGDVYCFRVNAGTADFSGVETSGATQVASVATGASLTFTNSSLDANGDLVAEVYGTGVLTITQSSITNAQANSNGIQINQIGGTAVIGNCYFAIPSGTGKAISGIAGTTLLHSGNVFAYNTNTSVSSEITQIPLSTLSPLQPVNPSFTGSIYLDGSNIVFEGAAPDNFETTLSVSNPTADRTITVPDANGTVMLDTSIYDDIQFSNGASLTLSGSDLEITSEHSLVLRPQNNGSVLIQSDDGLSQWQFTNNVLTLPANADILNSNGVSVLGQGGNANTGNVTFDGVSIFGNSNSLILKSDTTPDYGVEIFNSIDNDTHLRPLNRDKGIALGFAYGMGSHVRVEGYNGQGGVPGTGDRVGIFAMNNDTGASAEWLFGNDGNITFPDASVQTGASISISELKTLVASSVDFADFQSKIAAL